MMRTFWPAVSLLALAACSDPATPVDEADTSQSDASVEAETEDMDQTASFEDSELILPLPESTSTEITAEDIGTRVATLADDAYEGRGPGSEAGENSALWIAREMERVGLGRANAGRVCLWPYDQWPFLW